MRSIATQIVRQLPTDTRSDGDLLTGFLAAGTQAEADFGELVRRHGPLIWGVCRRALPDAADAEDAFQAVFLVLARRANRLKTTSTIAPWLYRVATWTVRNIRRRNARQRARRVSLSDQHTARAADPDLPLDLDAALLSLPEKYRSPVVLCHLLGYSRAAAAERLGCPEGTLSSWLSRGLSKLRVKLRGLDPAKLLGVAATAVPVGLSASAVRAAVASRVAAAATAAISSTVSQLVEGVIHMFWVKKATAAAFALFAVFALGVGVGISTRQVVADANGQYKVPDAKPDQTTKPNDVNRAKKIQDLEAQVKAGRETLNATLLGVKLTAEKIALYKGKNIVSPKDMQFDLDNLASFQKRADEAADNLKRLRNEVEILKATPAGADGQDKPVAAATGQPANANDVDRAKKIRYLELRITAAREGFDLANEVLKGAKQLVAFVREASTDPTILHDSLEILAKSEKQVDDAGANLKRLSDELEKLKAAQPASPASSPPLKADSERQLLDLATKFAALREDRAALMKESAEKALELDKRIQDLTEAYKAIQLQAMLDKNAAPATKSTAYVELTLHGKEAWFEYSIRETDANGKEIGRVITREPAMLLKLLTRIKNDPSAPKELRVIADPSIALNGTVTAGFKACDAAGFAKVKFTGYMPQALFLQELKSDQKGDVAGFKRYANEEVAPSSLAKEMETWMHTY